MMWDYDAFIAKAKLYFTRGEEHPAAEDDVLALWLLLGLEFLLRAPLANVHASLLADPTGNSIMHAAGLPVGPDGSSPKSIQTKTVIARLASIVPGFDPERQEDAAFLVGLRNSELHSSDAALDIDISTWLPHFTRVLDVICAHLELNPFSLISNEIIYQGRALVDKADKRLEHEVKQRIDAARAFYEHLRPEEIESRKVAPASLSSPESIIQLQLAGRGERKYIPTARVTCPACDETAVMRLESVRTTYERLDEHEIVRDVIYIAVHFACRVCDLELKNTAEVRAAGIEQQHVRRLRENIEDRVLGAYDGEDYGND